jgi:hypothetical protein
MVSKRKQTQADFPKNFCSESQTKIEKAHKPVLVFEVRAFCLNCGAMLKDILSLGQICEIFFYPLDGQHYCRAPVEAVVMVSYSADS